MNNNSEFMPVECLNVPKVLFYDMVVQTAADVNIKRAVCISMMRRKMPKRTKS